LPPLALHTLFTRDATPLKRWIEIRPPNAFTVLDTHDGIGVIDAGADREGRAAGLLPPADIDALVETIHVRSRGESRLATGAAANNLDLYQVNCTFYDALGCSDAEYLIARAIQCFVPGIPQIYYVGLLAGSNDLDLLRASGVGRDINRHYYTAAELREQLARPVVRSLLALLRFRNSHAAFNGTFRIEASPADQLVLVWSDGDEVARLDVDLTQMCASVTCSTGGERVWQVAAQS
jgi:sucrose phosphorylase